MMICYFFPSIFKGFIEELEYLEKQFKGILLNNHYDTFIFLPFKCSFEECYKYLICYLKKKKKDEFFTLRK